MPSSPVAIYLLKSALVFAAIAAIVAARWRRFHPFPVFGAANAVTTVRAMAASLAAGLIGEPPTPAIAAAAVVAGATATLLDGVDGALARRTRMTSAFGARYDVEIDALLIQVLAILVWRHHKAGAWVLMSGLWRYLFVAAGVLLPWMRRPLAPTRRAKAVCVAQIGGLLVVLLPAVRPPGSTAIAGVSLALLSCSFVIDIVRLWRLR